MTLESRGRLQPCGKSSTKTIVIGALAHAQKCDAEVGRQRELATAVKAKPILNTTHRTGALKRRLARVELWLSLPISKCGRHHSDIPDTLSSCYTPATRLLAQMHACARWLRKSVVAGARREFAKLLKRLAQNIHDLYQVKVRRYAGYRTQCWRHMASPYTTFTASGGRVLLARTT